MVASNGTKKVDNQMNNRATILISGENTSDFDNGLHMITVYRDDLWDAVEYSEWFDAKNSPSIHAWPWVPERALIECEAVQYQTEDGFEIHADGNPRDDNPDIRIIRYRYIIAKDRVRNLTSPIKFENLPATEEPLIGD